MKLSLKVKIIGMFLIVAAITLVIGVVNKQGIKKLQEHIENLGMVKLPAVKHLLNIDMRNDEIEGCLERLMNPSLSAADRSETVKEIGDSKRELLEHSAEYEKLALSEKEKELFAKYKPLGRDRLGQMETFLALQSQWSERMTEAEKTDLFARLNSQNQVVDEIGNKANKVMDELVELTEKLAVEADEAADQEVKSVTLESNLLVGLNFVLAIVLGMVMGGYISRTINGVSEKLLHGAEQTVAASSQVSAASQMLAEGASEQAASLEETSASIEELTSMTRMSSDNADKTNQKAGAARQATDGSAEDVNALSSAMTAMAKIIKSIDEIAFQTNILALNAAVEAARAGEAGMGFAVVADEVRNLAKRSADAAHETADKIEQGVSLTKKVKQSLDQTVGLVRDVDKLVGEISTASKEQAQGIGQISIAVSQMDKVTQSSAASAEETASASEELNALAQSTNEAVHELLRLVNGGGAEAAFAQAKVKTASTATASARLTGASSAPASRKALLSGLRN